MHSVDKNKVNQKGFTMGHVQFVMTWYIKQLMHVFSNQNIHLKHKTFSQSKINLAFEN